MSAFSESGGLEVAALRQHEHPAILRLPDADVDRQRMVAEYHPLGNLEEKIGQLRGDIAGALAALLPVVEAVARQVMELLGWRTRAMLGRYHIVSQADLAEAAAKIDRARGA